MKKTYEKPELIVESFNVEDIITESSLETVGGGKQGMENSISISDMFPW